MWYAILCDRSVYADQNPKCLDKERVIREYRTLSALALDYPRAFIVRDDMPTMTRAGSVVNNWYNS
jgi:hypothetical protein